MENRARIQNSPLLKLAPELRNRIYHEILSSSKPVILDAKAQGLRRPNPALLQTCLQVRTEAIGIYYARNVFQATAYEYAFDYAQREEMCTTMLLTWLRAIGKDSSKMLRAIYLDDHYHSNQPGGSDNPEASGGLERYRSVLREADLFIDDCVLYVEVKRDGDTEWIGDGERPEAARKIAEAGPDLD
ncbi:hypothetical protein LTR85_005337 [Meristemomyces frigidus]|nr:hypothetical protein LTR85_005337 [Meristemomyces frigidus]